MLVFLRAFVIEENGRDFHLRVIWKMELKTYKIILRNTGQDKCQYYEWPSKWIGEREMKKEWVFNYGL